MTATKDIIISKNMRNDKEMRMEAEGRPGGPFGGRAASSRGRRCARLDADTSHRLRITRLGVGLGIELRFEIELETGLELEIESGWTWN